MLKHYLEKMISFACDLQKVPHVDVIYQMPENQKSKIVKYRPGCQGALYIDLESFKQEGKKSLFALFTELRRYYQDYHNMDYHQEIDYAIDANAFAVVIMKTYFGMDVPINNDLPMTKVMLASHQLLKTLPLK